MVSYNCLAPLTPDTGYGIIHWFESDDSEFLAFGRNLQSFKDEG
jgi:hypothetical protein